ncbi:MAG: DUF2484 family protein [Cypionkella sp.]
MSALTLALIWLIAANLIAMLPTKDHHWRAAYSLMALGLPLALWVFQTHGAPWTLAFLLAAASILRWPLYYLWQRIKRLARQVR